MTVSGNEQRVYGTLSGSVKGTLILIPINYTWTQCCNNFPRGSYHVFPNLTITLPKIEEIYRITLVSGYNIVGAVRHRTLPTNNYLIFDQLEEDTTNNYVSVYGAGMDDVLWIYNNYTSRGIALYCGYGYDQGIIICTYNGEPNLDYIFNLVENNQQSITLSFECSDYWGYAIGGTLGYIAVDCSFPENPFVKHPFNNYVGYAYYKKYGWTAGPI